MPTPARCSLNFVVQDNRGFRALARVNAHVDDILATMVTDLGDFATAVAGVGTAIGNMTNAKIVSTGFSFEFDIAQEPSSETGTYQLVQQGARLNFGDGKTQTAHLTIPAPKDSLFLTSASENLIVVNPAASILTALQTATNVFNTADDGIVFSQFFGGQLREGKPRRRRVLQGA